MSAQEWEKTQQRVILLLEQANHLSSQAATLRQMATEILRQHNVYQLALHHHHDIVEDWHGKAGRSEG